MASVFSLPMRDGNSLKESVCGVQPFRFLVFLWGMETSRGKIFRHWHTEFLVFLWGMETSQPIYITTPNQSVFSLPMRDGNKLKALSLHRQLLVFSLPMRDGNTGSGPASWRHNNVFSLPMRDGNCSTRTELCLWDYVFSLPMRDGNLVAALYREIKFLSF